MQIRYFLCQALGRIPPKQVQQAIGASEKTVCEWRFARGRSGKTLQSPRCVRELHEVFCCADQSPYITAADGSIEDFLLPVDPVRIAKKDVRIGTRHLSDDPVPCCRQHSRHGRAGPPNPGESGQTENGLDHCRRSSSVIALAAM
jgi:hypothetical protein